MVRKLYFNTSAQLYEDEYGDLAVRFGNNAVFDGVGICSGKGFVAEALEVINNGVRPTEWHEIPYRKLLHDGHGWHQVASLGFIDGDETTLAIGLEVKPEELGYQARHYLNQETSLKSMLIEA